MQSNYGHIPTCCIIFIFLYFGSTPLINATPAVGVLIPVNTLMRVDFPAPLGPIMPNISPF